MLHRVELIAAFHYSHPNHVNMIWHQAKNWAGQSIAKHRMRQKFAVAIQKRNCQPTRSSVQDRQRPVYDRVVLVIRTRQSFEVITIWHQVTLQSRKMVVDEAMSPSLLYYHLLTWTRGLVHYGG